MLQLERRRDIIRIISEKKSVTVKELCAMLYVSPATVRRDLYELEADGLIKRSFGGAVMNETFPNQVPASVRSVDKIEVKKHIAAKAASVVQSGETVFIDGSTTTYYLAQYLKGIPDITVITNNPKLSLALAENHVRSLCTGGEMLNESLIYAGSAAERFIRGIRAHRFFFSSRGIDTQCITDSCDRQCAIKQAMMECAEKSYFLCDRGKFGHTYPYVVCNVTNVTEIITEDA